MLDSIKRIFVKVHQGQLGHHAAALSFDIMLALVPLLFLTLVLGAFIFSQEVVVSLLLTSAESTFGSDILNFLRNLITNTINFQGTTAVSVVGIGIIVLAVSRTLREIDSAFSSFFPQRAPVKLSRAQYVVWYGLGFISLLLFLVATIALLATRSVISTYALVAMESLMAPPLVLSILSSFLTIILSIIFFTFVYRTLAHDRLNWRAALYGAMVASVLFSVLNVLFLVVLNAGAGYAAFGVASSFVGFMLWVYYSVYAVLLGAATASALDEKMTLKRG